MRRIAGETLWLGHAGDSRDLRAIHDAGIQALVDLAADERPPMLTRDLIYYRFPIVDGGGNPAWLLRGAVNAVAHLLRNDVPTLVYCSAGLSRTPAVAACAVAIVTNAPPEECLKRIVGSGPSDVSIALWQELLTTLFATGAAS